MPAWRKFTNGRQPGNPPPLLIDGHHRAMRTKTMEFLHEGKKLRRRLEISFEEDETSRLNAMDERSQRIVQLRTRKAHDD